MKVKYERVGDLDLNVRDNNGETFYNLESIFAQSEKPCFVQAKFVYGVYKVWTLKYIYALGVFL